MITYELSLQLKRVGYKNYSKCFSATEDLPNPTLSELIESCGQLEFFELVVLKTITKGVYAYMAFSENRCMYKKTKAYSSYESAEEAVANLWLALNLCDNESGSI